MREFGGTYIQMPNKIENVQIHFFFIGRFVEKCPRDII